MNEVTLFPSCLPNGVGFGYFGIVDRNLDLPPFRDLTDLKNSLFPSRILRFL